MVAMPSAVRHRVEVELLAELQQRRACARARSSRMWPPRKRASLSRPSTRSASVTVGSVAAAAVAGRPRIGAGAVRPDMQAAALVAPRDRAAAGPDLDDIDDRQLHRLAGEGIADDVAFLDRRDAVGDQRRLRGGAAHVEADGALDAEKSRDASGADHAGDRPGFHHRDRRAPRLADRHGAAVRAHDGDLPGKARLVGELFEPAADSG